MTSEVEEKSTQREYKNAKVHVKINRKAHCVVEYEVEATKELCEEAEKKAAKSVGKDVVVPGFRKGKAPIEVVAKRYPHELDKRWQETIANDSYAECAQLANVPLISQDANITFKMHSHSKEGAKLTLSFETIPVIPSIDPAKCVLSEVKRPEVSKEKVEETIRQAQMFFGKWEVIEGRPVHKGDYVLLNVDVLDENPPKNLFRNTRFEVSDKAMAKWMQELVLGKKKGDLLEGVSQPDPELSEEEKKEYPPKKVQVTIKEIEKVNLPELNDAFAAQLGVKSVQELHEKVEGLLNKKADEHVREIQREMVTDFLFSHHFDLPQSVIQKETQFRLQQMIQDPPFKKQWDESNETTRRDLVNKVMSNAEKAVRLFYLCRKISADQNLSITQKDFEQQTPEFLEMLLYPGAQYHDPRQPDIKQAESYSRILLEKTEDWVIAHARMGTVKEKPKTEEKKEEEEKPKKKTTPKKTGEKAAEKGEKETLKKKVASTAKKGKG